MNPIDSKKALYSVGLSERQNNAFHLKKLKIHCNRDHQGSLIQKELRILYETHLILFKAKLNEGIENREMWRPNLKMLFSKASPKSGQRKKKRRETNQSSKN